MWHKRYLLTPGPTPVPAEVGLRLAEPIIHHRTREFSAIVSEVRDGLRALFQTAQDVLLLAASGTGAMEAAVSNLFSPGDAIVVVNGGKFGDRWARIGERFGLRVSEIPVVWGEGVSAAAVEEALSAQPAARAVLFQGTETSTTALHPIEAVVQVARSRGVLSIVDGITTVGVLDCPMDRWGIDVLLTGSQKALMLPPGLALIALSEAAWDAAGRAQLPRFYFDLGRERKNQAEGTTAYTPAISLVVALSTVLRRLQAEGLPAVYARHARLAAATRAGVQALGLPLLAPRSPSPAATGIRLPGGIDGGWLVRYLREQLGVSVAGGQDQLKGKVVRISHMGDVGAFDVVVAIAALEMGLCRFGIEMERGRGVAAAEQVLAEVLPEPTAGGR